MARRLSREWCISAFSLSLFSAYGYPTFHGPKISHYDALLSLFSPGLLLILDSGLWCYYCLSWRGRVLNCLVLVSKRHSTLNKRGCHALDFV